MGAPGSPIQPVRTILVRLRMAATLVLDPLVRPGIEQQRHLVEVLQENQEVEEVESKVEEGESKVEVVEDKVEVVEKPLPALEKNCRLASTSALDSMRASLAPVWQDVQSVALSDPSQDLNRSMHHNVPLLQPSTQKHPNQPLL